MKREFTNSIRYVLDNFLPPILRDSRIFMYPMFYVWFKGKNVTKQMEFKKRIETMSEQEYIEAYAIYDSVAKGKRPTDISEQSIEFIFDKITEDKTQSILDVGCGNGYLLELLQKRGYNNLVGCDIINELNNPSLKFVSGNIEALPFADKSFDTVMCNHTLEHILKSQRAITELKRVAKKRLIVTTPCQRYSPYTFDLHVNFYPQKIDLLNLLDMPNYECYNLGGDWSFIGYIE